MGCCESKPSDTAGSRKAKHETTESSVVEESAPRGGSTNSAAKLPPKKEDRPPPGSNHNNVETGQSNQQQDYNEVSQDSARAPPPPPTTRPRRETVPMDPLEIEAQEKRRQLMEEVTKPTVKDFGDLDQEDSVVAKPCNAGDGDEADADAVIIAFNEDFDGRVERGEIDPNTTGLSAGDTSRPTSTSQGGSGELGEPPTDDWFLANNLPFPVVEWYQNNSTVYIVIRYGSEECDAGWDLEQNEILRYILHSAEGECHQHAMHLSNPVKDHEFVILGDSLCIKAKKVGPPHTDWVDLFKANPATLAKITWLQRRLDLEQEVRAEEDAAAKASQEEAVQQQQAPVALTATQADTDEERNIGLDKPEGDLQSPEMSI